MPDPLRGAARLVVEAGTAVLEPDVIRRGVALLIENGRIAAIDTPAALADVEAQRMGSAHSVVLPGFVDAHQHGRARPIAELGVRDAPLEDWLVSLAALPAVDPYSATVAVCSRLAAVGATTTLHSHGSGATTAEEYDADLRATLRAYGDARIRGVVAAEIRDQGVPVYGDAATFLAGLPTVLRERLLELVPAPVPLEQLLEVVAGLSAEVKRGDFGDVGLAFGPPGLPWCTEALLLEVARRAEQSATQVHTHLLESRTQLAFSRAEPGGAIGLLTRMGLLTSRLSAAHGIWLDDVDREALAAAGATIVTNPGSNLRLHSGIGGVRELLDAGVAVALGTDDTSLNDTGELLDELRLADALQRGRGNSGLTPTERLAMLTASGGRAVGRSDVGLIRVGGPADLVIVDIEELGHARTVEDPVALTLAVARRDNFAAVIAGGRIVARHGISELPAPTIAVGEVDPVAAETMQMLAPYIRDHYTRLRESRAHVPRLDRASFAVDDLDADG